MSVMQISTGDLPTTGLPREAYVDPVWYERDLELVFKPRWMWAAHISQLPEAGSYIVYELGTESVIIVRDESGVVRGFHNVCRHRGAQLLDRPHGQCAGPIVCPYHGWSYRHDGSLKAAPRMHEGFSVDDLGLHPAPVEVWNGMVFVCLADTAPLPVATQLAEVDFGPYALEQTRVVGVDEHIVEANWKLVWENGLECYHCALNHPELKSVVQVIRDGPQPSHIETGEFDFRPEYPVLPGRSTLTLDGQLQSERLLGLADAPPDRVSFLQWHTTGLEIVCAKDHAIVLSYRPLAPTRTSVRLIGLVHEDAEAGRDFDPATLFELHRLTRDQDDALVERVQKGVMSSRYTPGPFNEGYEFMNRNFVRLYREAIEARKID